MRIERVTPGTRPPSGLEGSVLARDVMVGGERWPKGRRLSRADLGALAGVPAGPPVTILLPGPHEVHEDDAARRLAGALAAGSPSVTLRGPAQSRVDLVAAVHGVVDVRTGALERLNRLDPLEVFTVFDGQVVAPGDLVASVKIGPHLVPEATLVAGEALAGRRAGVVRVLPFRPARIAVIVKEHVTGAARARFEGSMQARVAGLGASLVAIDYVADELASVTAALAAHTHGRGRSHIVLAAGGASTDPDDPFFRALEGLGGRIVRHGVPAHPGSMLWLGRIGGSAVIGLPSCGAYSKATAADLLLPRLVAGQPGTAATVARLAHGGILTRSQRFRFPAYARDLDAPDG